MARTIDEIQQSMLDAITADPVLSPVATSTSKVAIFRLFTRIVAACAWTVEVLFDTHKAEVNETIANLKPHTLRWYANKAKDFQYGFDLPLDSDVYNNASFTEEQIDESKIVSYVAVTEGNDKRLRIKCAKNDGADLAPLAAEELQSFSEYMARIKDAGVKLNIESNQADRIKLELKVYYDPLILDSNGSRIDGANSQPVQSAVKNYLKSLPFNGYFVLAYLTDTLQQVDGVVIPHIVSCETAYAAFGFSSVDVMYLPDAGYLRFENDTDLTITFIAQEKLV
ncbi:hypothetical protein [Chryseosolibacter indicus]|uniref:Nucleotidyltransferase n=1 Tax=Chryseosolibacter indicus TaxID=2782351 RepID=A0ABS5VNM6_9BACT|nr:hypothetical protein [Chryseosolibacter indicus]MBT1702966.1 hypothetical protein [Chryseosolibacter indicus]